MGDIFRRHPEYFIPDQETGFQKVASGCCAYNDVRYISKLFTSCEKNITLKIIIS
jgi:spore cortex formation protein SpoVR/YcgB (stage V sporulation)